MTLKLNKLVYIMSPSYSGSTLLTSLLARHDGIATVGELKASALGDLSSYRCSCGQRILDCPFWLTLVEAADQAGVRLDLSERPLHFRSARYIEDRVLRARTRGVTFESLRRSVIKMMPTWAERFRQKTELNWLVARLVTELQSASVFLDGSKDPHRLIYLYANRPCPAGAIVLTRDGRGVCNSMIKHTGISMERAATIWVTKIDEIESARGQLESKDVLNVKYEDLCQNVETSLQSICDWIGVSDYLEYSSDARPQHLLGNSMRLVKLEKIAVDNSWKDRLSSNELRLFGKIAGKRNAAMGYDP